MLNEQYIGALLLKTQTITWFHKEYYFACVGFVHFGTPAKKTVRCKKLLEIAIKNNTTGGGSTTTLTADTAYHANTTCTAFTASMLKHCLLSGIHPCTWLGRSGIKSIHRALWALGQKVGWVMDGYPLDCLTPKHMRC